MFFPKSIEQTKRLARALRAELLARAGTNVPYGDCLDALALMYGHTSFREMSKVVGRAQASPPDGEVGDGKLLERRQEQLNVLIDMGIDPEAAEDVLDAVPPTGDVGPSKSLARTAFADDEIEIIREHMPSGELVRSALRALAFKDTIPETAEIVNDWLIVALVGEGQDADRLLIPHVLALHAKGVTIKQFVSAVGDAMEIMCSSRGADDAGTENEEDDEGGVTPSEHLFVEATHAMKALSTRLAPPPVEADTADLLAFVARGIALSQFDDALEPSEIPAVVSRLEKEVAEAKATGSTLYDVASVVGIASGFDPFSDLSECDLLSMAPEIVARIPAGESAPLRDLDGAEPLLIKAINQVLAAGHVEVFDGSEVRITPFDAGVIRCDLSPCIAIDALAHAGAAGLTLQDLAEAIADVFEAGLAVGTANDSPETATGTPCAMPQLDPDLAAVAVCCDWGRNWRDIVTELCRFHAKGFTLTDLCGHWLAFDILDNADEDEDEGYDGPLEVMETLGIFSMTPPPGGLTGAFAILKAALGAADDWFRDEASLSAALKRIDGLSEEVAKALASSLDLTADVEAEQVAATVDVLWKAAADNGARHRLETAILTSAVSLASARFLCSDPDGLGAPAGRLTPTEVAYATLMAAGRHWTSGDLSMEVSFSEASVFHVALNVAGNMRKVLEANGERFAKMQSLIAAWPAVQAD